MSIEAINWAMGVETGSPGCKLVLIILANYANDENEAWPSQKTLTTKTEQGEKTVWRHIKDLEEKGFITSQARFSKDGCRSSNLYRLNINNPSVKMTDSQNDRQSFCPENSVLPPVKMTGNPSIKPFDPSDTAKPAETAKKPARKTRPVSEEITLSQYLTECRAKGEKPIPENDPVMEYAESIRLPKQMLALAWSEFKARYIAAGKKQKDWRATFRNAVKGNYYKFWYVNGDSKFELTTAGKQKEMEMQHG